MSEMTQSAVLAMTATDVPQLLAAIKAPETASRLQLILKDPKVAVHVSRILQEHRATQVAQEAEQNRQEALLNPPTTEQLAEEAAQIAAEPDATVQPVQPVQQVPDFTAEDAAWKNEGVTITRDASGKITRVHQEYQVRTEDGTPIGRPTSLIAGSLLELIGKQRIAHENATRAFARLKKQKVTFQQENKSVLTDEQIKAAAEAVIQEKDLKKAEDVVRAAIESQYAQREQEIASKNAQAEGRRISNEFLRNHLHDYKPCDANTNAISEYLKENRMEFTLDNLETAFEDLMSEDKLVKVQTFQRTAEPVANTTDLAAASSAAPVGTPPVSQPVAVQTPVAQLVVESTLPAAATATTPVTANQPQVTRRPGVNGGLTPGTMSAHRPTVVDPADARKVFMQKIDAMTTEQFKRFKADPLNVRQAATFGIKL
jgi:hypothetical protein